MKPGNIADLRLQARARLPRLVFDYVDGAAQDEIPMRRNNSDFEAITFAPRMLVDVSNRDMRVELFGRRLSMPLLLAPTGLTGLIWPDGEVHAAVAAEEADVGYCLSSNSTVSIERLSEAVKHPFWFQTYLMRDRELTHSMILRAKAAGCEALVLTVDLPVAGRRERDLLNGFSIPPKLTPHNLLNILSKPSWLKSYLLGPEISFGNYKLEAGQSFVDMARFISNQFDQSASWDTVGWAKAAFAGPVLVKGILTASDAITAIQAGADALIVSNHGGRQLDNVSSSIRALPEVVQAVDGRVPVLIDGGVRRGADIARALALGATACLIGRPFLYGLAIAGKSGVQTAIEMLRAELDNTLALLGTPVAAEIPRDAVEMQWASITRC